MIKRSKQVSLFLLFLLLIGEYIYSVEIKLGTTAPAGSPWDFALKELASRWNTISNGRVRVRLYLGGVAGDEDDMVRKTRIGQMQAVVVTGSGLSAISPEMLALSLPLFVRDDSELEYLLDNLEGRFNSILESKGFSVIAWQRAGWLRVFSKRSALTPAELRLHRLALPLDDSSFQQIWRAMGFNIISIQASDFLTGLQTGMVDAIISAPVLAAAYQRFPLAPNMNEIAFAPLVGALIIDTRTWNRLPKAMQEDLIKSAREILDPLQMETGRLEEEAVAFMKTMNLQVSETTPELMEEWADLSSRAYSTIIGSTISQELFNEMERVLKDYRLKVER